MGCSYWEKLLLTCISLTYILGTGQRTSHRSNTDNYLLSRWVAAGIKGTIGGATAWGDRYGRTVTDRIKPHHERVLENNKKSIKIMA